MCIDGEPYENGCDRLCRGQSDSMLSEQAPRPIMNEMCNSVDDDCDGSVDEALMERCETDNPRCVMGSRTCDDGQWSACEPVAQDRPEECNGVDDDCDGRIDEGLVEQSCRTNVRMCEEGIRSCEGGEWSMCKPLRQDRPKVCNSVDDDCDGRVDENPILSPSGTCESQTCEDCLLDWKPVCTVEGLMPNQCLADCLGLRVLPNEECGLANAFGGCRVDEDCAPQMCDSGFNLRTCEFRCMCSGV